LSTKILRAHETTVLLGIVGVISGGKYSMVGEYAKSPSVRTSAKISGVGQRRIYDTLQNRTDNDHLTISPQRTSAGEYLSWSPGAGIADRRILATHGAEAVVKSAEVSR
jgi:hypothetical protein